MAGDQDYINLARERDALLDLIAAVKSVMLESRRGASPFVRLDDLEEILGVVTEENVRRP